MGSTSGKKRHRERGVPLRRCLVTGEELPKSEMIRFVVGPDNQVVADLEEKLPGRGMWLSAKRNVLNTAAEKKAFSRAARQKVDVPDDFVRNAEARLAGRVMDLIGLARRAGNVVSGFEKVRAFLKEGRQGLLLAASDGARGGRDKLLAVRSGGIELDALSSAELGRALGRDNAVHAIVAPGKLAERIRREMSRLQGVRGPVEIIDGRAQTR